MRRRARRPVGRTWVAGGLYRLVRRDFRWGDAPTIELGAVAPITSMPPSMRIYALERALTREERVAELAFAPHDLVGRDAEKADLHAAYPPRGHRPAARSCRARHRRRDGHRQDGAGRHVPLRAAARCARAARRVLAGAHRAPLRHRERVRARRDRRRPPSKRSTRSTSHIAASSARSPRASAAQLMATTPGRARDRAKDGTGDDEDLGLPTQADLQRRALPARQPRAAGSRSSS